MKQPNIARNIHSNIIFVEYRNVINILKNLHL